MGGGTDVDDFVEEELQIRKLALEPLAAQTLAGVGAIDRKVELLLVGIEIDKEVVDLVQDLGGPGVVAVDLVDHHDRRQTELERLGEHETGLRQRSLGGVHQQQDTIDHLQGPLDLAAEIGVAGGVDDVDLDALVAHGGVLGEDGDAALTLEIAGVHHAFGNPFVGAEGAALPQHGIHQGGLAVVDVGDDREISEFGHGKGSLSGRSERARSCST